MSLEDHPVVHGQRAGDPLLVKLLDAAHGDLPLRTRGEIWRIKLGSALAVPLNGSGCARDHGCTRTGPALPARHRLVPGPAIDGGKELLGFGLMLLGVRFGNNVLRRPK